MKRKMITAFLAVVLVFVLGTVAFAAEETQTGDVIVNVVQENVYNTVISWEDLKFTYTYTGVETGSWNKTSAKITVENNSTNASIMVSSGMEKKGTVSGVTVTYNGTGAAETLDPGADKVYTVSVSGTPANYTQTGVLIGTISVTVSN